MLISSTTFSSLRESTSVVCGLSCVPPISLATLPPSPEICSVLKALASRIRAIVATDTVPYSSGRQSSIGPAPPSWLCCIHHATPRATPLIATTVATTASTKRITIFRVPRRAWSWAWKKFIVALSLSRRPASKLRPRRTRHGGAAVEAHLLGLALAGIIDLEEHRPAEAGGPRHQHGWEAL